MRNDYFLLVGNVTAFLIVIAFLFFIFQANRKPKMPPTAYFVLAFLFLSGFFYSDVVMSQTGVVYLILSVFFLYLAFKKAKLAAPDRIVIPPHWAARSLVFLFALALLNRAWLINPMRIADLGFHLVFAKESILSFPAVPGTIPLMRGEPFLYPPLTFSVLAALNLAFGGSLFWLTKVFLVVVDSLVLFPVYLISRKVYKDELSAISSAALSALFVNLFDIETHLSTAFSLFFALLAAYFFLSFMDSRAKKHLLAVSVLLTLTLLTHFLPFIFFTLLFASFAILEHRGRKSNILSLLLVFFLVLLFSSFWLQRFWGYDIFQKPDRASLDILPQDKVAGWTLSIQDMVVDYVGLGLFFSFLCGLFIPPKAHRGFLLLWLGISAFLLFSNYLGTYFFIVGRRYLIFIVPLLAVFGGRAVSLFVGSALDRKTGQMQRMFLALLVFLIFFNFLAARYFMVTYIQSRGALTEMDVTASYWLRENARYGSVILADNGHAFWLPYLSNLKVINGRKYDEFQSSKADSDVAMMYLEKNISIRRRLMEKYGVEYVLYSNMTAYPFPYLTMEDFFGRSPAVLLWHANDFDLASFENSCYTPNYRDVQGEGSVLMFRWLC